MVEESDENLSEVGIDHCLDGRRVLDRKQLPYSNKAEQFCGLVFVENQLAKNVEVLEIKLHFVRNIACE